MTGQTPRTQERVNLSTAEVMIAAGDPEALEIMAQMFAGFGVHTPRRCSTGGEAMAVAKNRELNLMVVDSNLADGEGYDVVQWLRRSETTNAYVPVILVLGHTTPTQIARARDAGASFVLRKPVLPIVMMQRIVWLLNDPRQFVTSTNYCGPDRRVRALGPPVGMKGRRHDDLSVDVGDATTPNLEQDEIDALFQPKALSR